MRSFWALALLATLAFVDVGCSKARGEAGRAVELLPHEVTNRVVHHAHRRRAEGAEAPHDSDPRQAGGATAPPAPPDHRTAQRRAHQQEVDDLLAGDGLLHVKPRNNTAAPHSAGARKAFKQPGAGRQLGGAKHGELGGAMGGAKHGDMTKDFKTRRGNGKLSGAKKHAAKKTAHKTLRTRQARKELKEKLGKKEKTLNKDKQKAKALLKEEKAQKKKEKRERKAKALANKKRE